MTEGLLYIAYKAPLGEAKVSETLQSRGLSYYRTAPCEISAIVNCPNISSGYASYAHNLSAHMRSVSDPNEVFIRSTSYYPILSKSTLRVALPPLCLAFSSMDDNLRQSVVSLGGHPQVLFRKTLYIFTQYSPDDLTALFRDPRCDQFVHSPGNAVNLNALRQYTLCCKIAVNFFLTQRYPTYADFEDTKKRKADVALGAEERKEDTSSSSAQTGTSIPKGQVAGSELELMQMSLLLHTSSLYRPN